MDTHFANMRSLIQVGHGHFFCGYSRTKGYKRSAECVHRDNGGRSMLLLEHHSLYPRGGGGVGGGRTPT